MSNNSAGHYAEKQAAKYITYLGYKIITLNWKNKLCEIDIIAEKNRVIHFVEVKYRRNLNQGSGFDYITPKKLKQMSFAAQLWVQINNWNKEYCLSAIELTGNEYKVTNFLTFI